MEYSKISRNLIFAVLNLTIIRGQKVLPVFHADQIIIRLPYSFRRRKLGYRFKSQRGQLHFFFFHRFLPFGFLLFILTADPVSFARFLRKRISSFRENFFKIGNSRRNIKLLVTGYYLTADSHMPNRKEGKWPRDFNALGKCLL